ncbi:hypothetical protein JOD63_002082 [Microbacterium terrae]|uniref:Uncharacterized protein n=1 Tax=Microbacterium terrae TaxID=69369 RepID=A0A0M2H6I2_9MICO|nr:hypothetical protein [Microbacterium terrae]KJL39522.1 hypothetical protein RS81_01939 [Microbacterium terrae]MBP1078114.1 hypothetical protein [Microbacterium terrae]GLK00284.1 hypothetical protein GCM10017594_34820 [Microbacterium terrae]
MTRVDFEYDHATVIPVPGADLGSGDVGAWAHDAAARLAGIHGFTPTQTDALAGALARAQAAAVDDPSTNLLMYEPTSGAWGPIRLTLTGWEPDADEQRRYLWPASVLAPRVRHAPTAGLGEGCSSTVMDEDGRGSVRWLFQTTDASFFAVLGPMEAAGIAFAATRVEELLDSIRLGDAPWTASARFDVGSLIAPPEGAEGSWRL